MDAMQIFDKMGEGYLLLINSEAALLVAGPSRSGSDIPVERVEAHKLIVGDVPPRFKNLELVVPLAQFR